MAPSTRLFPFSLHPEWLVIRVAQILPKAQACVLAESYQIYLARADEYPVMVVHPKTYADEIILVSIFLLNVSAYVFGLGNALQVQHS